MATFRPPTRATIFATSPSLPDMGGLWNPIFGEAEPNSPRPDRRKTDLILAIGAQKGVKKEFLSAVTARIEKLGTKSNGVTRSGRLDLRYEGTGYRSPP